MPSFRAQVLLGIAERKTVLWCLSPPDAEPLLAIEKLLNFHICIIISGEKVKTKR